MNVLLVRMNMIVEVTHKTHFSYFDCVFRFRDLAFYGSSLIYYFFSGYCMEDIRHGRLETNFRRANAARFGRGEMR